MKKLLSLILILSMMLGLASFASAEDGMFTPGTYTGNGFGKNSRIVLDVTFSENEILDIQVVSHGETAGICEVAFDRLPGEILKYQSLGVDTVASATESSKGIIAAVEDAVIQAGGDVEALRAVEIVKEQSDEVIVEEADICVIGAGVSGSVAAIQATDLGAKVIILEKTASTGVRGGTFFAADSHLVEEAGVEPVDVESFFRDYMDDTGWRADGTLVRDWIEMSKSTVGYLEKHGCQFKKHLDPLSGGNDYGSVGYGGTMYDTTEYTEIQQIANALKCIEDNGGALYTDTTATGLIVDENGTVCGVMATRADGSKMQVNAKSVILATGGYGADFDWISKSYNGVMPTANFGVATNVGDGIKMAAELGAAEVGESAVMLRMPRLVGDFNTYNDYDSGDGRVKLGKRFQYAVPLLPMTMWVNSSGERICDENEVCYNRNFTGNIVMSQGGYVYVLMNEKMLKTLAEEGAGALNMTQPQGMGYINNYTLLEQGWGDVFMVADGLVEQGVAYKGNTIEELAENAGMKPEILAATLKTYNEACAAGEDDTFFKAPEFLSGMEEGPYYLFTENVCVLTSLGGLKVSRYMEVQSMNAAERNYSEIPGLYACGTCTGGIYGDHYANAEGVAHSYAITSARTAACYAYNNAFGTSYNHLELGE